MVQKSGIHQLREVGSLSTIIYKVWTTSQVVVWDFGTINSMKTVVSDRAEGIRSLWKVSLFLVVFRGQKTVIMYVYLNIHINIIVYRYMYIFLKKMQGHIRDMNFMHRYCVHIAYISKYKFIVYLNHLL